MNDNTEDRLEKVEERKQKFYDWFRTHVTHVRRSGYVNCIELVKREMSLFTF